MSISTSRRFLLPSTAADTPAAPPQPRPGFGSFDINVVMVLSVLLCSLICSLCLNALLKCALRCSTLLASMSWRHGGSLVVYPKGVRRNVLKKFPTVEYSKEANKLRGIDGECVICLTEYEAGDRVRVLPKCCHAFHVNCIDKWLSSHTSCPKCRNCLTDTSRKVDAGCGSAVAVEGSSSSVGPPPPAEEVVVNVVIAPVEREGLMCNYRESSR